MAKSECSTCGKIECEHVGFARLTPEERSARGKRGGEKSQAKWEKRGSKGRPHRFTPKSAREARRLRGDVGE